MQQSEKILKVPNRAGSMTQVVEILLSKHKAPSSNPSTVLPQSTKQAMELKTIITEVIMRFFNSRLDQADDRISKLRTDNLKIIQSEEQKDKRMKEA
jgi:hypothetical protein